MTVFVPMTGLTLVLQNTPPDSTEVIGFYPSIINDSTAAADELLSQDSATSFYADPVASGCRQYSGHWGSSGRLGVEEIFIFQSG